MGTRETGQTWRNLSSKPWWSSPRRTSACRRRGASSARASLHLFPAPDAWRSALDQWDNRSCTKPLRGSFHPLFAFPSCCLFPHLRLALTIRLPEY
jgi:hypothetical protein